MTYQGYANKETWTVALHINNDQGLQDKVTDFFWTYDPSISTDEWLKDFVEELTIPENPLPSQLFMIDLLTDALACVNWTELSNHFHEYAQECAA